MKKNIIIALLLLFAIGLSNVLVAQTSGKKKKKKKKAKTKKTVNTDSINAARMQDSIAAALANQPPAVDTENALTNGLVADTSYLSYADLVLDTAKPVDGFYKQPLLRGAKPFAFPTENKFNIKFYKRLWRTIT